MSLKSKLTKEEMAAIAEPLRALYLPDGDVFRLDMEDADDSGALKRALERERAEAKKAKAELKELADAQKARDKEAAEAAEKRQREAGDVAALEASWKAKLDTREKELAETIAKQSRHLTQQLVDNKAVELATKISTAPAVMLPHIKARLTVEQQGDTFVTRILDKDGKPSAATLEDLAKEFSGNPDFAAVIVGSQASGGGASGGRSGGGASRLGADGKAFNFATATAAQIEAHIKATGGAKTSSGHALAT